MKLAEKLLMLHEDNFSRITKLESDIKRWKEALNGAEIKGDKKAISGYQSMIKNAEKELKSLSKLDTKKAMQAKDDKGANGGYQYEISDKEEFIKALSKLRSENNFYGNVITKIEDAVKNNKDVIFKIGEYSPSYKGGILFAVINGKETKLSKKKVKLNDLKYYLPLKDKK